MPELARHGHEHFRLDELQLLERAEHSLVLYLGRAGLDGADKRTVRAARLAEYARLANTDGPECGLTSHGLASYGVPGIQNIRERREPRALRFSPTQEVS